MQARDVSHAQQQQQEACAAATAAATSCSGGRCQQADDGAHYHHQQQQHQQHHKQRQQHQQQAPLPPLPPLRPPPARYASNASNLIGRTSGGGGACSSGPLPPPPPRQQQQQQQQRNRHLYHHHRWPPGKGPPLDEAVCTCVLPRTSVLCRLLVAMTVLLVFVQAVSCGMFFCVRLPAVGSGFHSAARADLYYQDLVAASSQLEERLPGSSIGSSSSSIGGSSTAGAGAATAAASQQQQPPGGGSSSQSSSTGGGGRLPQPLSAVPKLIPRIIHQTHRSRRHLSASARAFVQSWADVNGDAWQVRFYSDDASLAFVRAEFPEYFEAFTRLPRDVERADFFRYMVVLRLGGVYADVDAECRAPLDGVIAPADTLLVGWDAEARDGGAAAAAGLARTRTLANWFFAAAPGHPVLRALCDAIARRAAATFAGDAARDTAERTGAGLWTDLVLTHALRHRPAEHDDPWQVRILPRVAFGVRPPGGSAQPSSEDAALQLRPDSPGVVVLHHFAASWRQQARHRKALQVLQPLLLLRRRASLPDSRGDSMQAARGGAAALAPRSNASHFPVSAAFSPTFTVMTDLVGAGDTQAGEDVSAAITAHGSWQPALAPHRRPALVEALVGALGKHAASTAASGGGGSSSSSPSVATAAAAAAGSSAASRAGEEAAAAAAATRQAAAAAAAASVGGALQGGVLVDVGAGLGFFSLAAAARGHRVVAFEASPASLAALRASVAYNGFQQLVSVRASPLGATPGRVCLRLAPAHAPGCSDSQLSVSTSEPAAHNSTVSSSDAGAGASAQPSSRRMLPQAPAAAKSAQQQAATAAAAAAETAQQQLRRRRGYPWLADGPLVAADSACCAAAGERLTLSDALGNATDVAALRVSAHGHEGWVLQGAEAWLARVHRPAVIHVEFWPAAMRAAGYGDPAALLRRMYALGYSDIAHAGPLCDARWRNATRALHLHLGSFGLAAAGRAALQQPTWCKLRPEAFALLADGAESSAPENVLFLLSQQHAQQQPLPGSDASSESSTTSSSSGSATAPTSSTSSSAPPHLAPTTPPGLPPALQQPQQPQQAASFGTALSSSTSSSSGSSTGGSAPPRIAPL